MKKVLKKLLLKKESIITLESKEMSHLMGGRDSRYDCYTIYGECGEPTYFTGVTGETDCCPYGCCQTAYAYCGG